MRRAIVLVVGLVLLLAFGGAAAINTQGGSSLSDADQARLRACLPLLDDIQAHPRQTANRQRAATCEANINEVLTPSATTVPPTSSNSTTTSVAPPSSTTTIVGPSTTTTRPPTTTTTAPTTTTTVPTGSNARPPAGGYFALLPPGATFPTDAQCAAAVRRSTWEPRPNNNSAAANTSTAMFPTSAGANQTKPPVGFTFSNNLDFSEWNMVKGRVTGNFTGTTDEIMQWAACKWGWSDDWLRAQAEQETNWNQVGTGSWGDWINATTTPPCPRDWRNGTTFYFNSTSSACPQSFGLLQNKYRWQPADAYPWYRTSSAFALDYSLWKMRGCYEGLKNGHTEARGNLDLCLANWWSGEWSTGVSYDDSVRSFYNSKHWLTW